MKTIDMIRFAMELCEKSTLSLIEDMRDAPLTQPTSRLKCVVPEMAAFETDWQPFVEPFNLPRVQFDALIDGVAMDASPRRYETFADLEPYCHRVASSVGLMCAEIFGYRDRAVLDYARDLGVALQLTNILRDIAVDYRVGRFYLPAADLAKFDVTEADVRQEVEQSGQGVRSAQVRAALAHHARRAHEYFDRARRSLPREDASRFVAAEIMHAIYFELLQRIEAAQWDVFSALIRIPRPAQARLALKTWWRLRR